MTVELGYEWYLYVYGSMFGFIGLVYYLKEKGILAKLHCKRWK